MNRLFLLSVAILFLAGCDRGYGESSQAKAFLKRDPAAAGAVVALREYNRVLITVYQRNDVAPIKELVMEKEFNKLKHMIDGFQAQDLRMDAELKRLEIEKIERWGKDNVVIFTREKWHYRRVNSQTSAVVKPPGDIEYQMAYKMVLHAGRWQLFNLATL